MSAKDGPIARRAMTFEEIKRISEKLQGNGLPPGTPVYAPDDQIEALQAEGINAQPLPDVEEETLP